MQSYDSFAYNTALDSTFQPLHWPGVPSPLMLRVRSDEEDDNTLRRRMLGIHCISDLDDQARDTADMAFARRNRAITSADNYMDVGRALCATYELERNPHQMILSHGEELGIHLPEKWETAQDLYASIGEQFATRKRSEYNQALAKAEAAAKARRQELGQLAQSGLEKFMEGNADQITPEEHEGMTACGISRDSLQKARAACHCYRSGYGIGGQQEHPGILEINGPRSLATLAQMSDTIGDDACALDLAVQYIQRRTLQEERDRRHGGAIKGNFGSVQSAVQHIEKVADDWVNDTIGIIPGTILNIRDSFSDENVHWYDALGINPSVRQTRRNSFVATARQAHAEALAQAQSENPHILDSVSGTAVSVANAGKWLLPGKWLKASAVVSTLMENERTAAMKQFAATKDLSFKEYDFWDSVATPALKTGITAGTFAAVGAVNGAVGGAAAGLWGKTASANARQLAAKLMQNRVAAFAGHTLTAAATMEEISGLEWLLNLAADNTIVSDTQNTSREQADAILHGWTTSDGLTEKALTALVFGVMAAPGMVNKVQYEKWKSSMGMTPDQSKRYDAAKTPEDRRGILEEMRAADPSGFKSRAAKAGEQVISQAEMESLSKAGIEDYILKEAGYSKSTLPDGRFELTRKTIDADGKEVEEKRTYTQEQLNDYYATKHESLTFRAMVELQSRARAEKLAAAAERINSPFLKIITLDKLDPSLLSTLQDGQVTKATIRALAEKARTEIEAWTVRFKEQGKDELAARTAAEQQTMGESGVSLKTLSHIDKDFAARTAIARAAKTIGKGKEAATSAFLLPRGSAAPNSQIVNSTSYVVNPLGSLTLALARGEVREHEILHDLIEARIRLSFAKDPTAAAKMKEALLRVDADLRRRLGKDAGINLKGEISELELVEAMSHLATADFLAFHNNMPLSAETHAALETARSIMGDLQTISTLATAWKAYASTAKGKEALSANTNLLRDILEQSKAYVRDVYAESEKQTTREAADIIRSYDLRRQQERQKLIEDYYASRTPLTEEQMKQQPESPKHPEDVSAQDSITGEKIPAEKFYEAESVNQETGEILPPADAGAPQTDAQGKGKSLVNGTYHQAQNGHLYGAAEVSKIKVDTRFNHDRARQNIDRYDPATAPVLVFRDKQGNLTAIGNLGRLEQARSRSHALVDVEIVDESKAFTPAHAADTALEYAMRTDNATPTEILDFFTRHNMQRATVYERGLIPPSVNGELPPAAQLAWNLHENGSPRLKQLLRDGSFDVPTATRIADMAPADADTQAYIIKLKQSKRNFKWSTIEQKALKYSADRFNAFVAKNQADSSTSFSMREYRERKPLEELLREKRVSDLIQRSRAVARQFSAALALEGISDTQVQEYMGRVVGLHAALRKECTKNPRIRQGVEADLSRAEMRLRAMVDIIKGKADSSNIKSLPAEIQKAARESGDKLRFVCDYLRTTEADLIERAARTIEEEEMDIELSALDALIDKAHAKLQKNQRTAHGTISVDASRNAERYRRMMGMSRFEVSERLNATEAAIQKALSEDSVDSSAVSTLQGQQAELMTYGALRERGLDALRKGAESLRDYIATEAKSWEEAQDMRDSVIHENRLAIARSFEVSEKRSLGVAASGSPMSRRRATIDPGKLSRRKQKDDQSRLKNISRAFTNFASGYDLLERISNKLPLARQWKQRLAVATDSLNVTLNADKRNERSWIAENLGYRTDRQMALWLERTTTIRTTGIETEGVRSTKTHYLTLNEAERIIRLTPSERAAERTADRAEAARTGRIPSYPDEAAVADMSRRIDVRGYMDDKIQYMNTGAVRSDHRKSRNMELSQQQAANIVLLAEQQSYSLQMDALGYTPRVIEQLRKYAGEEVMAYAYWARDYLNHTGVREVFESRMGVTFPAEKDYWPGNFDTSSVTDNSNSFISGATMGRGIYPFLITRSLHNFEPNTALGVNEILRLTLQAHRTYETRSAIADEMRQTLGDPDTAARLRMLMGDWDFERIKDFISVVDGAYAADAVACRAERKVMSWNNMAKTLTWLPGRLTSIAVQISALNNARAAQGTSLFSLVREIVGIRTDSGEQVMTPRKIVELDCFKARYYEDGLYERLTALPQDSKFSTLSVVANTFMRFMGKADLWSNALGMTLLYRQEYRKMKSLYPDMEEAAIRKHCETIVSETLHLAAQPIDATDKSIRYITSSDPIAQMVWLCKSDALKSLATARTIGIRDRSSIPSTPESPAPDGAHSSQIAEGLGVALAETGTSRQPRRSLGGDGYIVNPPRGLASTILRGYDFYRYLLPGSLMAQTVRGIFSALNGSAPSPGDDNFPDWVLRNAIVGLTLGGYIESLPLIGGVISHQARNYVATGFTTGNRTSVDPFGLGDMAAVYDFLKLCNDIMSHDNRHWDAKATLKLANAIRGLGIAAGSLLPDTQAGAAVKASLNALNTAGNITRDFLIRRTNDERRRPPRHPKP